MLHISLLAPFGPEVRGISPYADGLLAGLRQQPNLSVDPIDYAGIYPRWLVPATTLDAQASGQALVHYGQPATWRRCAEQAGEVLHIQYWSSFTSYYLAAIAARARSLHKTVVVTVHNPAPHERIALTGLFERRLLRAAEHVVVHAAGDGAMLREEFGLLPDAVTVIPHGVTPRPIPAANPDRRDDCALLGLDPSKRYLVSFGNQRQYKGTEVLVAAWSRVKDRWPDTSLIIAGRTWEGGNVIARQVARLLGTRRQAEYLHGLVPQARELRLDLRLRYLSNEEIDALCRIGSGGAFAYTRFSGQSGAATMAAGWGLPLIVSRLGALGELAIDEQVRVIPDSIDDLARAIDHLLSRHDEATLRERQRERCVAISWPIVAARHADLYSRIRVPSHSM